MTRQGGRPALLTIAEAAPAMGISETTLWRLIRHHEITTVEIPSARGRGTRAMRRIETTEVDAFIKRNRVPAT